MDQQSLEDLLALIELRNITLAARRRNVSQSAYSRRLKAIEDKYEINLVDRSGRPAVPTQALKAMREEIEFALISLKRVSNSFSRSVDMDPAISIAAVHSLSEGSLPLALSKIEDQLSQLRIHIHSANQDICFQLLMTEEVSLMLAYETDDKKLQAPEGLVKKTFVTMDRLVPVSTPALAKKIKDISPGDELIPLIAYPSDIFLGEVLYRDILVHSTHIYSKKLVAGMASVGLASAKAGLGVAWLPASVIKNEIQNRQLVVIEELGFLGVDLEISMLQLRTKDMQQLSPLLNALVEAISVTVNEESLVQEKLETK